MASRICEPSRAEPAGSRAGSPEPNAEPAGSRAGSPEPDAEPAGSQAGSPEPNAEPAGSQAGSPEPNGEPAGSRAGSPEPNAEPAGSRAGSPEPDAEPAGSARLGSARQFASRVKSVCVLRCKPSVFANEGILQARSFAFLAAFVQRAVKKQKSRRYLLANIYGTL
ncbi:hypothetical protein L596_013001 [Steinernema carpocapsae]|uniref:Uncharacterized protein n=1 Tax=Steinernema carpocapsae TaxID=34508 RepID=A0A4U5NYS9_STECR|nr:hypothetical protein L596_013001 [Steinernema carpocapsae]